MKTYEEFKLDTAENKKLFIQQYPKIGKLYNVIKHSNYYELSNILKYSNLSNLSNNIFPVHILYDEVIKFIFLSNNVSPGCFIYYDYPTFQVFRQYELYEHTCIFIRSWVDNYINKCGNKLEKCNIKDYVNYTKKMILNFQLTSLKIQL